MRYFQGHISIKHNHNQGGECSAENTVENYQYFFIENISNNIKGKEHEFRINKMLVFTTGLTVLTVLTVVSLTTHHFDIKS